MGRHRKVHKNILEILRKADHPLTYSEIKKEYKITQKKEISSALSANLRHLLDLDLIERTIDFVKNLKGTVRYKPTKSYYEKYTKEVIISQIEKAKTIDWRYLALPVLQVSGDLDLKHEDRNVEEKLRSLFNETCISIQKVIANNFAFHAYKILTQKFTKEERKTIKHLLGSLVWINEKLTTINNPHFTFKRQNLSEMLKWQCSWKDEVDNLSIDEALQKYQPSIVEALKLIDPEDKLLGINRRTQIHMYHALAGSILHLLGKEDTDRISGTIDESKKLFTENFELFERFMKELRSINFIFLLYFGNKELEETWDKSVVERFERWMKDLKEGRLDRSTSLFTDGLRKAKKIMRILRQEKRLYENVEIELSKWKNEWNIEIDDFCGWTFLDLWRDHPEGKDLELYKGIVKAIQERAKLIKSNDDSHKIWSSEF